jgi:hypothetical protein
MNATLSKALVAVVPAAILFVGSVLLFLSERTLGFFLQLLGAECLVMVVLATSAKPFTCSLGCIGARNIASDTTSTCGVLFLGSRCFLLDICFMH